RARERGEVLATLCEQVFCEFDILQHARDKVLHGILVASPEGNEGLRSILLEAHVVTDAYQVLTDPPAQGEDRAAITGSLRGLPVHIDPRTLEPAGCNLTLALVVHQGRSR